MVSKELQFAIREVLSDSIRRCNYFNDNFGARMNTWGPVRSVRMLFENGIRIGEREVTQNGKRIATIQRRYSTRKVHLCYKQLQPRIIFEEAA